MNYWFKEKLCEFCECWAIAKLLISICIHRWLHLISCETFSKCFWKLWVFRRRNFLLLTLVFHTSLWLLLRNDRQTFILKRLKYSRRKTESQRKTETNKQKAKILRYHTQESWIIYQDIHSVIDICYHNMWARFVGISIVTCAN